MFVSSARPPITHRPTRSSRDGRARLATLHQHAVPPCAPQSRTIELTSDVRNAKNPSALRVDNIDPVRVRVLARTRRGTSWRARPSWLLLLAGRVRVLHPGRGGYELRVLGMRDVRQWRGIVLCERKSPGFRARVGFANLSAKTAPSLLMSVVGAVVTGHRAQSCQCISAECARDMI